MAGLQRAKTQGKRFGRPRASIPVNRIHSVSNLPVRVAAERLGVSRSTLKRWRRQTADSSRRPVNGLDLRL
jgi:transposase-like protein